MLAIALLLLALLLSSFLFAGLIAKLTKSLHDCLFVSLVGIVLNGHSLIVDVGLNTLDTFLETEVALNLGFAALAMHLRHRGYYDSLNVL